MTTAQLIFSIYIYSIVAVYMASFWKLFQLVGRKPWEGLVPGYNIYVWLKIMKKPWWWIFFFVPYFEFAPLHFSFLFDGVVFLVMLIMNVELGRTFNKHTPKDILLFLLLPQVAIAKLTYFDKPEYVGATDWSNEEHREKRKAGDHLILAICTLGAGHVVTYLFMALGSRNKKGKKTMVKEWGDAFLFALIAASVIRTDVVEAFNIPSPSMEKELLVGDFLFVSKVSYGPKLPNTPIAIPFVHNTIPVINTKSYVEWQKRPYRRMPGIGSIHRNDIVVFNFPAGDTAINDPGTDGLMGHDYYAQLRTRAFNMFLKDRAKGNWPTNVKNAMMQFEEEKNTYLAKARFFFNNNYGLIYRPVDKRENYIKRCVAIAGDSLEIIGGVILINGKATEQLENVQLRHDVIVDPHIVNEPFETHFNKLVQNAKENYGINATEFDPDPVNNRFSVLLTPENYKKFASFYGESNVIAQDLPKGHHTFEQADTLPTDNWSNIRSTFRQIDPYADKKSPLFPYLPIYPNHPSVNWTEDNFGPIYIPKKGDKIDVSIEKNYHIYKRVIETYEGRSIDRVDGETRIDGEPVQFYEFGMNYYWLMGDNRHQSADSRFWGFVPEDHVVGKAVFIWFSRDPEGGIRWDRMFRAI